NCSPATPRPTRRRCGRGFRATCAAARGTTASSAPRCRSPAETGGRAMADNGIGARLKAREDPAMLRGETKYTADLAPPDTLHMELLRSGHGHAAIRRIDTTVAAKMPGV